MKLKVTLMMLFVAAFSLGAYAQACCTGASVSYPNGATSIAYTPTVETTTSSSTIGYVGDPNVIYMEGTTYSAPSTTIGTYQGSYGSSETFYAARSCCQGGTGTAYPTGNTATVTSYGNTSTGTDYGIGAGDPNVIYMTGVTTSISTTTSIPTYTSDVGNSCCSGPGISYPGSTGSY